MKLGTFLRFFRQLKGKKPVNIDAIQSMGLLAAIEKHLDLRLQNPRVRRPSECVSGIRAVLRRKRKRAARCV